MSFQISDLFYTFAFTVVRYSLVNISSAKMMFLHILNILYNNLPNVHLNSYSNRNVIVVKMCV